MPVQITCRGLEITEDFRNLVTKKVRKLKRFFEKVDAIDVVFSAEKHRRACEIIVSAGPFRIVAQEENGDEGTAFDKALKSCERQIKESKTRMIMRKRTPNPDKQTARTTATLPVV